MSDTSSDPLHLFRINSGSCNGCDVELTVTEAVAKFDVATLGCVYCESPSQAQIVLVTGPLTERLREQILALHSAVPEPKVTVAIGVCPVSCGVFRDSYAVAGPVERYLPLDVNVPGCPPRPQAILAGIAEAIRLWRQKSAGETVVPTAPLVEEQAPERLRGSPRFRASACVGCRMCAHVCAGGAITFQEQREAIGFTLWTNSCVFCGLCAHYCPTGALTLGGEWCMTHLHEARYRLAEEGKVPYVTCAGCGETFLPAAPELMRRAFRGSGSDMERLRTLCPECRLALNLTAAVRGVRR